MTFASAFTITNRMTLTIARIDPTRAVTPLSCFAPSRLRVRLKHLDSVKSVPSVVPSFRAFRVFRGYSCREAT